MSQATEPNGHMDLGDPTPIEVRVRIGANEYLLREADEADAVFWRNHQAKCLRYREGKLIGIEGAAEGEPLLVSRCLYSVPPHGGDPVRVPLEVVRRFPSRIVRPLFKRAREISQLEETAQSLEEQMDALARRLAEERGTEADFERRLAEVRTKALQHQESSPNG